MADTEQSLIDTPGIPEIEYVVEVLNAPVIEETVEVFGMTQTAVDKTLSIDDMAADAKATGQAIANVLLALNDYEQDVDSRTAADLPMDDSQDPISVQEAVTELAADLSDFEDDVNSRTAGDIPFDDSQDPESIQEVVSGIGDTLSDLQQQMFNSMFPIGSIYVSTVSTAPSFPNTAWEEVLPVATLNQLRAGSTDYEVGTGTGTVHYWRRIAVPEPVEDDEEEGET